MAISKKANILIWLTLIISSLLISPTLSELCHPQDKKALLQIKQAFNNPYVLASWDPQTDCCDWHLVRCDERTHRITAVHVTSEGLSGQIPPSVADLPYLDTLIFSRQPGLVGPIQPAIAKMARLKRLMITNTNVSGTIPDFLGGLRSLGFLDLSANALVGPIPASLGNLPRLTGLRLDNNNLSGPIPPSLADFITKDFYLNLAHNQLSGPIPASFERTDFTFVDLSDNHLEGDPSPLFGANKATNFVDLSRNMLAFDLSKIRFSTTLRTLDLSHNRITGAIPASLASPGYNLHILNVSYNLLCGKIPADEKLQAFGYSAYIHNKCLCGPPLSKAC